MRRLTFVSNNGVVDLISDQQVDMLVPNRRPVPEDAVVPFSYEFLDSEGAVVSRVAERDPLESHMEVFSPDGSISRVPAPDDMERVFVVVIPEINAVEDVRIMRMVPPSELDGIRSFGATQVGPVEVGRFKLKKHGG